ncbi:glycosyltransferase involved in cell wall biosynthesis [Rhodothalassium salexigens DSM 2132]|uniref:Glycosyltransferase involved in cell wall biosynthesis n=1 Tax=Rhodothalassium salexigens DSM 2132 TaxID=1188247 RepID=A0A4R2PI50_RHOSA|nr:glycosyl transferase family 2 [Rhodothalassium salexigens]MBB4211853.1 hypothetical protein [Rhodothalassium salexigens DSM 2132]MBK1638850.1 hypothetical protein [Rhodothalassium salexigens DSM 2132]TCP33851.1 glycosyltransferase involved in cell wall biosynthesis [Rhodothalassium salexigens DSM 2132]
MTARPPHISVIIPARDGEDRLERLLDALEPHRAADMEVIVSAGRNRADALNRGAADAHGRHLWFLHADTRLGYEAPDALRRSIRRYPLALRYFDLAFDDDGPALTRLNAWGANARSRLLGLPYGDQGLSLHRALFEVVGGFPEDVACGEDHLFVWRARGLGVRVRPVGVRLVTSARRYADEGWLATTARFQYRMVGQALPAWWRNRRRR